ncbi:DUF3667 domain-containing protein [uncultured Aquimarina sp.]|uniref:DUF3667 domain-containing protein n=1 Tax=uncultured Aquimarina sp. TaxID=575652 RepID=UPI002632CC45|nr:DUF3667 domain-containing protein [uncultured Aquimarina sp.]
MDCKNCGYHLANKAEFCHNCGARVVNQRLNLTKIIQDFFNKVFGWENNYFKTFKNMVISPDVIVSDYIDGVRKRHMSPITFLVIGTTIATLIFNMFSEKYLELNTAAFSDEDTYRSLFDPTGRKNSLTTPEEMKKYEEDFKIYKDGQTEFQTKWTKGMLKYFNLAAFMFIPFYTLISLLVFGWKKHNYSEHLVINCYIQGLSMIGTTVFFIAALIIHPNIYLFGVIVALFYYSFTYKKLYTLSFGKLLWKIVKFLIILILAFLIVTVIGGILVFALGLVGKT